MLLWHFLTRLGEAQILLPAALLATLMLVKRPEGRPLAAWWMALLVAAALLATASKVAFVGWGIGWPELDFTGVSGHAMFAAAVYPPLLGTLASHAQRSGRCLAIVAGSILAILVGVPRVEVGAHSVSEVLAGLLLGGAASAIALTRARLPNGLMGPVIPAALAVWLSLMALHAPPSRTHATVTRLALMLSGHKARYTRNDMRRSLRQRQNMQCKPPTCPGVGSTLQSEVPAVCLRRGASCRCDNRG